MICVQIHRDFIVPLEREGFILRMYDIIKRAESMMLRQQPGGSAASPHLSAPPTLSDSLVGSLDSIITVFVYLDVVTEKLLLSLQDMAPSRHISRSPPSLPGKKRWF